MYVPDIPDIVPEAWPHGHCGDNEQATGLRY